MEPEAFMTDSGGERSGLWRGREKIRPMAGGCQRASGAAPFDRRAGFGMAADLDIRAGFGMRA